MVVPRPNQAIIIDASFIYIYIYTFEHFFCFIFILTYHYKTILTNVGKNKNGVFNLSLKEKEYASQQCYCNAIARTRNINSQ